MRRVGNERAVQEALTTLGFDVVRLTATKGGDIARAYRAECRGGDPVFVKSGNAAVIEAEQTGLRELAGTHSGLVVPSPLASGEAGDESLLVLEWLESAPAVDKYWEALGRGLADVHKHTGEQYGYQESNFIGRLPQPNEPCADWCEFFVSRRLGPQIRMAKDGGHWDPRWDRPIGEVLRRMTDWIPGRPAISLVHGDLWSGNAMATTRGPAVIDPAVYYGHREVDLAMSELFGGFSTRFYSAYDEAFPLDAGYSERRDLYNLYHLLNHLNHFGRGYAGAVDRVVRAYGS